MGRDTLARSLLYNEQQQSIQSPQAGQHVAGVK